MTVIDTLNKMQLDAVEQLRAGDHSEFLVGFLTTSVMLELSNLVAADLDLASYAQAVVDVLTQQAPIERGRLCIAPDELPSVSAAVGIAPDQFSDQSHGEDVSVADFCIDGVATCRLLLVDVPSALRSGGFVGAAVGQISSGLGRVVEGEQLRRRAAAAKAVRAVAGLDERWHQPDLELIAVALASLPAATGASIDATAARFGGTLSATSGRSGPHLLERQFVVDGQLEVSVIVQYAEDPVGEHVARIDDVVAALATGLERIEQNIRLAAEADTDQLTGVGNRRRASKALTNARAMADTRGVQMAVLMCDLDHFKRVNDSFGHDAGDAVLVAFAALLRTSVRALDTVIRWGGEEFLVICPGCDQDGALGLADRLIASCRDACRAALADGEQTVSIGIAVYPTAAKTPEALVAAADEALYRAKREGRCQHRTA